MSSRTKFLLTSAIAAIAVYFLLSNLSDLSDIPETLRKVSPGALLFAFALYISSLPFKALRFRFILDINVKLHRLLSIVALQTFWTNLLPMRTGDFSYVYLLRRGEKVSATKGIASLMSAAIIDILLIMLLMFGTAWHLKGNFLERGRFSYSILFFMPILGVIAVVSMAMLLIFYREPCIRAVEKMAIASKKIRITAFSYFVEKFAKLIYELTNISFDRRLLGIVVCSIANLGLRFGMQCYLVKAMKIDLEVVNIIFALCFTVFFNMFPIQSFGNFGTVEVPWVLALTALGVPKESAIISGFSLHILTLLYSFLLGAYGAISKRIYEKRLDRAPRD